MFQDKIKSKINNLHYADKDYFITASYILDLANRAHELFVSSEMEQKRQLIKLVFQNLRLEGRTVCYDYAKPFNQIFKYADRQLKLPLIDTFRKRRIEFSSESVYATNFQFVLAFYSWYNAYNVNNDFFRDSILRTIIGSLRYDLIKTMF